MTRISAIDPSTATGHTKEMLDGVQKGLGMTPNLMKTLAHSNSALEGYLNLNKALSHGALLDAKFREQLAIAIAQSNSCDYCLSAHTLLGKGAGLSPDAVSAARVGHSTDLKVEAGLKFALEVVSKRGQISDAALEQVRAAGYSDGQIAEIIAHVALNIFTNYFNNIAQTDVDFPRVSTQTA